MGERRPSLSHAYVPLLTLLLLVLIAQPIDARSKKPKPYVPPVGYDKIKHTVVIFLEGWSFESLLPAWPGVDRLANATQSSMEGFKFRVLPAPLLAPVNGTRSPDLRFPADAPVAGFDLSLYYPPTAPTPPLVQRFWQEQYQINAGKMDKFVAWGGAGGLPLGYANSSTMPLTAMAAKEGAILANVHHSIYGGGFANLMYLTCGSILKWPSAPVRYEPSCAHSLSCCGLCICSACVLVPLTCPSLIHCPRLQTFTLHFVSFSRLIAAQRTTTLLSSDRERAPRRRRRHPLGLRRE